MRPEDKTAVGRVANPQGFFAGQNGQAAMPMPNGAAPVGKVAVAATVPAATLQSDGKVNNFLSDAHKITRRFMVRWNGSIREWASGSAESKRSLTWSVDPNHLDIFRTKVHGPEAGGNDKRIGDLSKVIVLGARVLTRSNPLPVDVAVRIPGLKGNMYGASMEERYPAVLMAQFKSDRPEVAHVPDRYIETYPELIQNYGHLTRASIEKGLMRSPHEPATFVQVGSVIATLIELNAESLNINLAMVKPVDGQYYKIANEIVERCLDELENNVLKHQPYVDLSQFSATLVRADGRKWLDTDGMELEVDSDEYVAERRKARVEVKMCLEMTYVICDQDLQQKQ